MKEKRQSFKGSAWITENSPISLVDELIPILGKRDFLPRSSILCPRARVTHLTRNIKIFFVISMISLGLSRCERCSNLFREDFLAGWMFHYSMSLLRESLSRTLTAKENSAKKVKWLILYLSNKRSTLNFP